MPEPVVKCDARGKKGKLLCCKRLFDQSEANLAEIQPENHQNVQNTHFWQKAPGVNGLICVFHAFFNFATGQINTEG